MFDYLYSFGGITLPETLFGPSGLLNVNGSLMQVFILATGILGQLFVSHMNRSGFYFWTACNVAMVVVSLYLHSFGMAWLYVFYGFMCFYSMHQWGKRQNKLSTAYLDLSTSHLTMETLSWLSQNPQSLVVANYSKGVFVGVPALKDINFDKSADIPSDLQYILNYAVSCGCSLVRFDARTDRSPDLPTSWNTTKPMPNIISASN
jgi:hypothetical protein